MCVPMVGHRNHVITSGLVTTAKAVCACGLCSGMYCDTYVCMYINMQNNFELSLQAAAPYFEQVLVPIIILI